MKFHNPIVFTKVPLAGHFRYKDVFQIYPAELENMPKSNMQQHYPAILEYWTTKEEHVTTPPLFSSLKSFGENGAMILKQDKILSLLSTFTNHLFFRYDGYEGSWGMPMLKDNPGEEANSWSSKWCLPLFTAPDLKWGLINDFSVQKFADIEFIQHFPYYQNDPNLDTDNKKAITFPETIFLDLDSYYAKNPDIQSIVDTAVSYAVSSIELKRTKKTLSALAAFTAVETMVNLEYRATKNEACKECGQPRYKIAEKYREFLLKYIGPSDANKKKFNDFYKLRSKIVHTGQTFKTEKLFTHLPEDVAHKELVTHVSILQLAKFSIVQWLLKNPV